MDLRQVVPGEDVAADEIEGRSGARLSLLLSGFKDMSLALRDLESIVVERRLRHIGHPVLAMCANNAAIESDSAGKQEAVEEALAGAHRRY